LVIQSYCAISGVIVTSFPNAKLVLETTKPTKLQNVALINSNHNLLIAA
jgi:hypothetical protein